MAQCLCTVYRCSSTSVSCTPHNRSVAISLATTGEGAPQPSACLPVSARSTSNRICALRPHRPRSSLRTFAPHRYIPRPRRDLTAAAALRQHRSHSRTRALAHDIDTKAHRSFGARPSALVRWCSGGVGVGGHDARWFSAPKSRVAVDRSGLGAATFAASLSVEYDTRAVRQLPHSTLAHAQDAPRRIQKTHHNRDHKTVRTQVGSTACRPPARPDRTSALEFVRP